MAYVVKVSEAGAKIVAQIGDDSPSDWFVKGAPCGCSMDAGRCDTHRAKMEAIATAWYDYQHTSRAVYAAIENHADGFGVGMGSMGDWSGIRDSSPDAIDAMHAAMLKAVR